MPIFDFATPDLNKPYDFIAHYAQNAPDAEALVFREERVTYGELRQQVDAIAKALIASGIDQGDRVATLSAPHPDCVRVLLATVSIGAIWVGLNPRYQIDEMRHVITDSKPKLLFSRLQIGKRSYDNELQALKSAMPSLRLIAIGEDPVIENTLSMGEFLQNTVTDADLSQRRHGVSGESGCLIVYTSGTTGKPKGALLKQSAVVRQGKLSLAEFKPEPLRVINYYPVNHVAGIVANTLYTLVGGGTSVLVEQFNPGDVLEIIEREKITYWGAIPTMYKMCIDHPDFESRDLSSVQLISWGGSAASRDMIEFMAARFPYLSTLYAMTETTGGVLQITPCKDIEVLANSVGTPMADCEYRLVDENGSEVETGAVGEIQVRGDFLMLGYWNNPQATADTYTEDGWLKTGDLCKQSDDGNIQIVGRSKEMYKSGGFNIYPREVEQAIEAHPDTNLVAVVSAPDPLYNEVGHAFITLRPGSNQLTPEALKGHCRSLLAGYKIPKVFHLCPELPLLPNGKIDKKRLSQQALESLSD